LGDLHGTAGSPLGDLELVRIGHPSRVAGRFSRKERGAWVAAAGSAANARCIAGWQKPTTSTIDSAFQTRNCVLEVVAGRPRSLNAARTLQSRCAAAATLDGDATAAPSQSHGLPLSPRELCDPIEYRYSIRPHGR
jgi:hypothetical protein